jgi:hypothetical protein
MSEKLNLDQMCETILNSEKIERGEYEQYIHVMARHCLEDNTNLLPKSTQPHRIFAKFSEEVTAFPTQIGNATLDQTGYQYRDGRKKYIVTTLEDIYALEQEPTISKLLSRTMQPPESMGSEQ